ncbi:MAG: hypothetical protein BWK78_05635 [Thiotrichaceae bacterium IS1]|nr:MAG: hypothetical protein BWK78_05635 [Thiotrichaceae bacterium IS1]
MAEFNPRRALVILFGAKQWPHCTAVNKDYNEGENPFENSEKGVRDYFLSHLGIEQENLLPLFDSPSDPNVLVKEMKEFIEKRLTNSSPSITDLLLYYVGHGQGEKEDYCLLVRSTDEKSLNSTAFQIKLLKDIERSVEHLRCYLILDACFAGNVLHYAPRTSKGTVLLCSTMDEKACHSAGVEHRTVFTGAFLKVIEQNKGQKAISFSHLRTLVVNFIRETYKEDNDKIVIPEIYPLNQQEDIANLPIFAFHKPKERGKRIVKWHITTSSKGGVGKTLLSLFLVAYYTTNKKNIPLVIDLNGVNTDLKQLVCDSKYVVSYKQNKALKLHRMDLKNGNNLSVIKIEQKTGSYLLGWLKNPYELFSPQSFLGFLSTLREELPIVRDFFNKDTDLDTVIIDTNYHFGNLFSSQTDDDYEGFSAWENDRFFIWFIWVYRQVQNCYSQQHGQIDQLTQNQFNGDVGLMKEAARKIEKYVSRNMQYHQSPFIHVINPMSLTDDVSLLEKILGTGKEVAVLKELADDLTKSSEGYSFANMLTLMVDAQKKVLEDAGTGKSMKEVINADDNPFLTMLTQLVKDLKGEVDNNKNRLFTRKNTEGERPRNLFPIHTFEKVLASYHHKSYELAEIRKFDVYKTFKKLFSGFSS